MKSSGILSKIKSDYFLRKLFDNLLKKKTLDIIKYNNNLKYRIKININNYKEYSEIYSPIELEIKPIDDGYGNFINVYEENEKYFHFYFNNNPKERKRNYLKRKWKIKTIKIIIDYQVISFERLFSYCNCIEYINFKKFYRNNIKNMSYMFDECSSLKELNLSNFNTNNVTDMSLMFYDCSSLKELNLSNFNTNNVSDMSGMFYGCSSLKELNLFNFRMNKETDTLCMFSDCSSLKELILYNFYIKEVEYMDLMFLRCNHLNIRYKMSNKNPMEIRKILFG